MIDLTKHEAELRRAVDRAREKNVIVPTFQQMADPETVPAKVKDGLKDVGLWDIDPRNLFRITWKNEQKEMGGGFGGVNYITLPESLTGVPCKIVALAGKWFPTGCHKVGSSFGCLVPRLVTGQFDPTYHKAVWPSTGNFCRGGAFDAKLLACESVAILPEGMSRERFEWLSNISGEVIATPGCESNVKEIFDKTWELRRTRDNVVIFNQFEEMGNHLWHYAVTGRAMEEVIKEVGGHFVGSCFTSGSAGTSGAGCYLKEAFPGSKLAIGEAVQCPTLLNNGFGDHGIEGIGDKHIPWIHDVKATDMVIAIDDKDTRNLLRLFNDPKGQAYLKEQAGVPGELVEKLPWLGISGIANVLCCIKFAKYYELTENDVVVTVLTDSAGMYQSRIEELEAEQGAYTDTMAAVAHHLHMLGQKTDNLQELTYAERKRIHNLKYYTWVEQQGRTVEELNAQWYDYDNYWGGIHAQTEEIDRLITEFNDMVGLI